MKQDELVRHKITKKVGTIETKHNEDLFLVKFIDTFPSELVSKDLLISLDQHPNILE